ncbi:MAG: hypothetical protein ABIO71_03345 [Caldimonas sp.]
MGWRAVIAGLAAAAYVVATHWLMTSAPASDWNAVLVVGPMLLLAAWVAWRRGRRLLAGASALAVAALVVLAWRGAGVAPGSLYVAQHVVVHLLLAAVFGSTLQRQHEPLISVLARRVHGGSLSTGMAVYTRNLTMLWTLYFLAMAALSLGLFAFAPFPAWAVFANLVTPLALAALFVGEYLVRYWLHPEFERATLKQAIAAYSQRHD